MGTQTRVVTDNIDGIIGEEVPRAGNFTDFEVTGSVQADIDMGGYSLPASQSVANLAAQGPALYFDGVDDFVSLDALAAELVNVNNTQGCVVWKGKIHDFTSDYKRLWQFGNSDEIEFITLRVSSTNYKFQGVCYMIDTIQWEFETDNTFEENTEYDICVTQNGTTIEIYVNGKLEPITFTTSTDLTFWFADAEGVDNCRLGCKNDGVTGNLHFLKCTTNKFYALNVCPTAAEVLAMYEGDNVPFEYLGASTVENISGTTTAWENANIGTYDETGDLSLITSAAGQFCSLPDSNCPTITDKLYLFTFDIANLVGEWYIGSWGTAPKTRIDIADGKGTAVFTALNTSGLRLTAGSSGSAGDFSNFSLIQIGTVCQYEQDGINHNQLHDKSGNEFHGTIDGAVPINLPNNHVEQFKQPVVMTDDTAWLSVVPAGYMLEKIIFEGNNANAATLDLGATSGASDVFSQEVIAGSDINVVVLNKLFSKTTAQSLYLNDDGAGTWNGASVDATLYMSRVI